MSNNGTMLSRFRPPVHLVRVAATADVTARSLIILRSLLGRSLNGVSKFKYSTHNEHCQIRTNSNCNQSRQEANKETLRLLRSHNAFPLEGPTPALVALKKSKSQRTRPR